MRYIEIDEMDYIAGGYDYGSNDDADIPTYGTTGTQEQVQAAKDEYAAANNIANGLAAIIGAGAGLVVGAACEALSAGTATPVCVVVGGAVGNYVNSTVADGAKETLTTNR